MNVDQMPVKEAKFSDFLYILYKWKKFLIINLFLVGLITTVIVFLVPNEYKSTATVMIPPESSMGLGGLTGLLGGGGGSKSSLAAVGSKIFGTANTTEDVLLGILNSRTSLTAVINKFHLMKYYDIKDNNMDKAIKAFKSDISASPNEFSMIEFSIVNEDPQVSADIANFMVGLVDSSNIAFNIQRAKTNRIFIEKRYNKNISDLKDAEEVLYKFQKKYNIVAVPEQLGATVKAAAEVEAELTKKEMEAFMIKQSFSEESPQYRGIMAEVSLLKKKVQEIKSSPDLSANSNVLFPFKEMPDIAIEYLRAYRDVQIQQSIMEIVMPMYEQAKVEEQKSIPTIMVIDKAVPAQLKYSPKRAGIILGVFFLSLFLFVPFVIAGEKSV
ncbi:MAG: GumC family protein, partial [Syntrophothermus sp.]